MPQKDTGGVPWMAQETAEMCFGGLACWDDLRAGCVDIPGAVLNWWTTNEHPQKRWSFTHAVWQTELIPMTEAERTDGEGALGRFVNLLRDVHKCLEHKLHIKATAVASIDGELHLRGHSAEHKGLPLSPPSDAEWKPWAAQPIASKGGMQFAGLCDEMTQLLSNTKGRQFVITCSSSPKAGEHAVCEKPRPDGVLWFHEYAVLQMQKAPDGSGDWLVEVMNPHGCGGEFNGAWGDEDPRWKVLNQATFDVLKHSDGDDGIFWMGFEDFRNTFTRVDLCQTFISAESGPKTAWFHAKDHTLVKRTMTDWDLNGNWQHSPHWRLTLNSPSACTLSITQPTLKMLGRNDGWFPIGIGFKVVADVPTRERPTMASFTLPPHRVQDGANALQKTSPMKLVDSELAMVHAYRPPQNDRQVSLNLTLESELQYYIVPCVQWPDEFDEDEDEDIVWDSTPLFVECYAEAAFTMERYTDGVFADYHAPSILDTEEDKEAAVEEWFNNLPTRVWDTEASSDSAASSDNELDQPVVKPKENTRGEMARAKSCISNVTEGAAMPIIWPMMAMCGGPRETLMKPPAKLIQDGTESAFWGEAHNKEGSKSKGNIGSRAKGAIKER